MLLEDLDEVFGIWLNEGDVFEDVDMFGGLFYVVIGWVLVCGELLVVGDVLGFEFEVMDVDLCCIKCLKICCG